MELFKPLPRHFRSSNNKEIQPNIVNKLHFQWLSSFQLINQSITLSHQLSRAFYKTIKENNIILFDDLRDQLCCKCYVIQIPGLTYQTKVNKPKKISITTDVKATVNGINKKKRKKKVVNEIIRICTICNEVNYKSGKYNKPNVHIPDIKLNSNVSKASVIETPTNKPKKFSFLDKITSNKNDSADFIPFSPISASNNKLNNFTEPKKRHLTLLEREQLNKSLKKKRISLPLKDVKETNISSLQFLLNPNISK